MAEQARNDRGYSLVELMSVLGVLGVILTAVFLSLQALQVSANVAQRDAWVASSTADSLAYLDKTISQATSITAGDGISIQFETQDVNGVVIERHYIVVSSGHLTDSVSPMPGGSAVDHVIIQGFSGPDPPYYLPYCANSNDSSPTLFVYLLSDGSSTLDPTQARSVRLTVLIGYMGRTFSDSTQVFLRNRQY